MGQQVGLLTAFGAGLVSFLSPCVLPLVPAYLSFMTGLSVSELGARERRAREVLGPVLLFVSGFSLVFVASGATASLLGSLLLRYGDVLRIAGGVVVLLLGVVLLDLVRLPWLASLGPDPARSRSFGRGAAFVLGLLFPFALGTCAGPVYGAILVMAAQAGTVARGAALLVAYASGLAVPFVAVGMLFGTLAGKMRALRRHARTVNRVAGVVLVAMGVLMLTGWIDRVAAQLGRLLPAGVG